MGVGDWEFSEVLSGIAEDLDPVRSTIRSVRDGCADLSQARIEDVRPMTGRSHPRADCGGRTALPVRDVLRVRLPAVADSCESILWLRIPCSRKRVRHPPERGHLIGVKLRGAHQRWTHRQCGKTSLPAFRVGQRRQCRCGIRARWSPGFDARGSGGRRTASQDEQPDKKKSGPPVGHRSQRCKAGAAARACSSR